jgi:hypothetical protein
MHSPQVMQCRSTTGVPVIAWRRTSIEIGQLKEQIPHWTHRIDSGTTCAAARASRRDDSLWKRPLSIDYDVWGNRRRIFYNISLVCANGLSVHGGP